MAALGYEVGDDAAGAYGPGTVAAVRAFQERRGLRADGICGNDTWHALVEAGYRLGDRPLYLTHPMQRGDDVSALQSRLGALGFDAGRVDGIFGSRTDRALADFQRNAGLVTDSICGPATLAALARLGASFEAAYSSASLREREQVRRGSASLSGRLIAIGESGGLGPLAVVLRDAVAAAGGRTLLLRQPDQSAQAHEANEAQADAFVGFALEAPDEEGPAPVACSTSYYRAPSGWQSLEGRRLAELVHGPLPALLGVDDGGVRGMAVPLLRETRMPAVLTDLGPAAPAERHGREVGRALVDALRRWAAASCDD